MMVEKHLLEPSPYTPSICSPQQSSAASAASFTAATLSRHLTMFCPAQGLPARRHTTGSSWMQQRVSTLSLCLYLGLVCLCICLSLVSIHLEFYLCISLSVSVCLLCL